MAVVTKVTRVANPRRRNARGKYRLRTTRRKNAGRKKMTAKQIKYFGTARQRAGLKAARKRKRTSNPVSHRRTKRSSHAPRRRKINYTARPIKRRRRRTNPALVVTLGSVNPRRRTNRVAKTRKRRKAVSRRRRATNVRHRRTNVRRRRRTNKSRRTVYVVGNPRRRRTRRTNRRRHTVNRRRHRHMNRRRNPSILGISSPKGMLEVSGGILLGVGATKAINAAVSSSGIVSSLGTSPYMTILTTGVTAWVVGWAATKFMGPTIGGGAYAGGIAMTLSAAINAFLPSSISGYLSLGDLVNGNFVVPQNPIRAGMVMGASAPSARGMAAYAPAY
jgi:hypothetical protein